MTSTSIMIEDLTKAECSLLLYAETCVVDRSGLLEGQRMNEEDRDALKMFQKKGFLTFGRIPAKLLGKNIDQSSSKPTHWVRFTPQAWELANRLRQRRALQLVPYATKVFTEVDARAAGKNVA